MAKYLFSGLSRSDYISLHHLQKFRLLDQLVIHYLGWSDAKLRLAVQILYYSLEHDEISLLTIEKKRYLQNNYFFFTDDSLHQLRAKLANLKKYHIKSLKRRQNGVNKEHGKRGVFLLLDADQRDKLDHILQVRSISLHSFFTDYIEDQFNQLGD